jgi:hypothetical protein
MNKAPTRAEEKALAEKFAIGLEGTPAAQPSGELTEEDLQAIDLQYAAGKASGALDRARDHRALEQQVQRERCGL